jgi:hypothetical protein
MRNATRFRPAKVRTAAGFLDQESGSVTIFAIVGFAFCMVIIGLAFDLGRVMGIHTEVSSYADRMALASARELDGRPDALQRAIDAVDPDTSVVGRGHRLSLNGNFGIEVRQLTFLSALGATPARPDTISPMPGDVITATWRPGQFTFHNGFSATTADAATRYVIVDTSREREEFVLFPMMSALTPSLGDSITVSPQAVAGFERRMCNITPVMVCNTNEAAGGVFQPQVGQRTHFKLQGRRRSGDINNWAQDVFSLLDVSSRTPNALTNYITRSDPNTQCYGRQATIESGLNSSETPPNNGTRTAIASGFNSRFNAGASQRNFPAAVVNCLANSARLNAGRSVPVEGYVTMRIIGATNLNDALHDDEIFLENRGIIPPPASLNDENRREYPVLVR